MDLAFVAAEVRRTRVAAGQTQAELARRTGTTQSAISRLESGRLLPTLAVLERVAMATGRPLSITLGGPQTERGEPVPVTVRGTMAVRPVPVSGRPLPSAARHRPGMASAGFA